MLGRVLHLTRLLENLEKIVLTQIVAGYQNLQLLRIYLYTL